ncbi:hypothetical protein [Lacticaseibacillus daqingensis]|uniref:hypothetical protein n=1 Tax=Lacticaseibacillus daqingensis TaxID=2486014 RepID=UPI000F77562A|nr:hypothetical protein [Lacticaseibacillus daqingensis]
MKRKTLSIINVFVLIFGYGLLAGITEIIFGSSSMLSRGIALVIWVIIYWFITNITTRLRNKRLNRLWELADKLGYGPEDLKIKSGASYGTIDWALTQPDNPQFYPSNSVLDRLIKRLEADTKLASTSD